MTSIPASRRARAMILAHLSCPSRPTFATITLIVCAMVYPYSNRSLNLVRHPFGSSSDLTQVVPEHVEADYEHGDDGESYVGAADQVDETSPEAGLDEGEEGDAEDEHGDQVFPLEHGYPDEANEHEAHAYGRPGLGHAAHPQLVFGGRPVGAGDVGAGRVTLAGPQSVGVLLERL